MGSSQAISIEMIESKEYNDSVDSLKYILTLLKQHISLAQEAVDKHELLLKEGYRQHGVHATNKQGDKITFIPTNGMYELKALGALERAIDQFIRDH